MALSFPSSPSNGQTYSYNGDTYIFDGKRWGKQADSINVDDFVQKNGSGNVGIGTASPESKLHLYSSDQLSPLLTLQNHVNDIGGTGYNTGNYIDFKSTDGNATYTPQVRVGLEINDKSGDSGIPSEGAGNFVVYTAQGTDVDGNGILSKRLEVQEDGMVYASGTFSGAGNIVNMTRILSSATTNVTVANTLVTIAASQQTVTAKRANSSYIYDVVFSSESDNSTTNDNGFFILEYSVNGGAWNRINEVIVMGGVSDQAGGTANNTGKWLIHTTTNAGDSIAFRVLFSKTDVASVYFNQQSLGGQPAGTSNYCSGYIAELGV